MAKYQVNEGAHFHNGNLYGKGDVINTNVDLVAQFPNKFTKVPGDTPATKEPKTLPLGESKTVEVDEDKLPPKDKPEKDEDQQGTDEETSSDAEKESSEPAGKDVTETFPLAVEEDFKVFKSQGHYFVYDADDLAKPLNDEGVAKAKVDGIIKKALVK